MLWLGQKLVNVFTVSGMLKHWATFGNDTRSLCGRKVTKDTDRVITKRCLNCRRIKNATARAYLFGSFDVSSGYKSKGRSS